MLLVAIGSVLLILVVLSFSFAEAGTLLSAATDGRYRGEQSPEPNDAGEVGLASFGRVISSLIVFRVQLVVALSALMASSIDRSEFLDPFLFSALLTTAAVLAEIAGKLFALRSPEHVERVVRPLRRVAARIKPLWFRWG